MKYSKNGYKRNSKDRNNPFNIIDSGNITMKGVDFPVLGTDNLGNQQLMMPGGEYVYPGSSVYEVPLQNFPRHFRHGGLHDFSYAKKIPVFKTNKNNYIQSITDDVSQSFNAVVNPTFINNNKLNLRGSLNVDPGIGWDGSNKQFSDFGTPTINPNFGGNIQANYKLGKNVNLSGGTNFGTFVGDSPSTQPYWAGLNIKLKNGGGWKEKAVRFFSPKTADKIQSTENKLEGYTNPDANRILNAFLGNDANYELQNVDAYNLDANIVNTNTGKVDEKLTNFAMRNVGNARALNRIYENYDLDKANSVLDWATPFFFNDDASRNRGTVIDVAKDIYNTYPNEVNRHWVNFRDNALQQVDDAWVEGRDNVVNTVDDAWVDTRDAVDDAWVNTRDYVADLLPWKKGGEKLPRLKVINYPYGYRNMPPGHIEAALIDEHGNYLEDYNGMIPYINRWETSGNKPVRYKGSNKDVRTSIINLSESELNQFLKTAQTFTPGESTDIPFTDLSIPTAFGGNEGDYDFINSNCADGVCLALGMDASDYTRLGITDPKLVMDAVIKRDDVIKNTGKEVGFWEGVDRVTGFSDEVSETWEDIEDTASDVWEGTKDIASDTWDWLTDWQYGGSLPKAQYGLQPITAVQDNTYVDPGVTYQDLQTYGDGPNGSIRPAGPEMPWYSKLMNVMANPVEAFGRSIHNQDWWTGNLGKGHPISPQHSIDNNPMGGLNMMNTVFNPNKWAEDIDRAVEEGNYADAALQTALIAVPGARVAKNSKLLKTIRTNSKPKTVYNVAPTNTNVSSVADDAYSIGNKNTKAQKVLDENIWTTQNPIETTKYAMGDHSANSIRKGLLTGEPMTLTEYKIRFPWLTGNVGTNKTILDLKKSQGVRPNLNEYLIPKKRNLLNKFLYPKVKTTDLQPIPTHLLDDGLFQAGNYPLTYSSSNYFSKPYKYVSDQVRGATGVVDMPYEFNKYANYNTGLGYPVIQTNKPASYFDNTVQEWIDKQGYYEKGGSLPKAQDGDGIDFNSLQKGIKWVESLNGELMKNKQSSASGYYGQLFDEIEYDGTRDEFIADTTFQDELFRKRVYGEITDVPGLIDNGIQLFEEYKDVDHGLSKLEIAGLSNMLGRQGTRKYLGNVIRDGKTLAEVFPHLYGSNVNQANKTPDEYVKKFNQGLSKKSKGGEFVNKVKRLNEQLKIFNSGGKISPVAKQELIKLEMIKPEMEKGGAVQQNSYVTKRGDNLSRIAKNNNMTLSELLKFNPRFASNPSAIGIGDVVQLSDAPVQNNATPNMIYEIERGDSLSKIASRYGVRYQDIAALNNISNPSKIMPGQQIRLPDNAVATEPNVVAQQNRANSVYIPSQSNVLVNSNTGANEVWAKRKYNDATGEWTTEGKSVIIDEINKDTQANRIIRGMNDIAESQTINYTIKGGDMLSKIAKENGITTQQLIDDNNISDPTKIQPGQKITINKSTGKPYIIVDEKAGRMHMYYPGQTQPAKSYPIVAGLNEGDQQTKTVIHFFKDGEKIDQDAINKLMEENDFNEVGQITSLPGYSSETMWDLGNKSTGAGVYTIDAVNKETNYMGNSPSFVLANQAGNRPGTVIHSTPSASMTGRRRALKEGMSGDDARSLGTGTNGCINGTCSAMTELYDNPDIGEGTQIFVLPEDEGNNFVYENGQINFYTRQSNDEESMTYETKSGQVMVNPQGLNETPGNQQGNYKPINITFDKTYFQNNSDRYDGLAAGEEQEFNDATKPFLNSLADNKKKLMDKLGMDGDTYNDLAMIAFGIYGYESGMGDTNTTAENIVKGGAKVIGLTQTNPDVQSKQDYQDIKNYLTGDDGDWDSTGYTQAKWEWIERNPEAKATLAKLGINKDNYKEWTMDPAKSAEFTIARLYDFHQKTQASINKRNEDRRNGTFVKGDVYKFDPVEKYGEEEEVYDPWTQLPNQWSPTSPGYADFVNKYTDFITLTETDVDDLDNNLIIKGEYTDDNAESRKKIQENKKWTEKLLNPMETAEFLRLDARDAIDDVTGGAASYVGEVYDDTIDAVDEAWEGTKDAVSDVADDISEWWDEVDLSFWKLGGEFGVKNQVQFYDDYISGVYKGTRQENSANKLYDKLNRMYYNDSKKSGKSQIDVMRSILHSNR